MLISYSVAEDLPLTNLLCYADSQGPPSNIATDHDSYMYIFTEYFNFL